MSIHQNRRQSAQCSPRLPFEAVNRLHPELTLGIDRITGIAVSTGEPTRQLTCDCFRFGDARAIRSPPAYQSAGGRRLQLGRESELSTHRANVGHLPCKALMHSVNAGDQKAFAQWLTRTDFRRPAFQNGSFL